MRILLVGPAVLFMSSGLFAQGDDKDADEALKQFAAAWKKAARDDGGRIAAITALSNTKHDKILNVLIERIQSETSSAVKEALAGTIGQYDDSEKAAKTLVEELDKNGKQPNVMQKIFQGLGSIRNKRTRPYVKKVNEFVPHKDMSIAVPAVVALGAIRDKSSVTILMERLRKAQQDMREYVQGERLANCDGD